MRYRRFGGGGMMIVAADLYDGTIRWYIHISGAIMIIDHEN
jgi:hypothetical protein